MLWFSVLSRTLCSFKAQYSGSGARHNWVGRSRCHLCITSSISHKAGACHCSSYSENNSLSLSRENWQGYHQRRVARGCSWQQKWGYVNINIQRDSYLLEALAWKRCRDCINITLPLSHPRKFWGQPKPAIAGI